MPIWGISAAPLIFEDLVILHIGGRGACVVALNKHRRPRSLEGARRPRPILGADPRRSKPASRSSSAGRATASAAWPQQRATCCGGTNGSRENMPIGVATPVVHGDRVFFTSFYDGSLMLRLASGQAGGREALAARRRERKSANTDALQSIIATPVFDGTHIYGVDSYGELRCLDATTGDRLWEDLTAVPKDRWSTIHFVKNGDKYWLFNERGELIIARLSPQGFDEISRTKLLEPTTEQLRRRGGVCWSHPAFANRHIFQRNDKELVCASLADAEFGKSEPLCPLQFLRHEGQCAACCRRRADAATATGTDQLRRLRRSASRLSQPGRPASLDGVWGSACALVAAGLGRRNRRLRWSLSAHSARAPTIWPPIWSSSRPTAGPSIPPGKPSRTIGWCTTRRSATGCGC